MAEYLAPGVYVEEVSTGSKPIEGVSTSTAGLVGATERGPVNVPQLVTSFGEYRRTFGGYLDIEDFTGPGAPRAQLPAARGGGLLHQRRQAWLGGARAAARGDARRPAACSSTTPTSPTRT